MSISTLERELLLDAVTSAVRAAAFVPQLLNSKDARLYVGLSKSAWFRAKSAGKLPAAVFVEGAGDRFRKEDLDRFIRELKPRRVRRKEKS